MIKYIETTVKDGVETNAYILGSGLIIYIDDDKVTIHSGMASDVQFSVPIRIKDLKKVLNRVGVPANVEIN